ncbi:MAG: tyrosine-type recombinase/integrase [Clostridia bacterium]|nr:tyrosine-type recombinase/integrase [Clostridia bacterium]
MRLHDLRDSNATALIQAGINPRVVQQRLGHSDVNITLNTYTHVLPEMDEEAAAKLDSIVLHRA